jgi:hypothetical protein
MYLSVITAIVSSSPKSSWAKGDRDAYKADTSPAADGGRLVRGHCFTIFEVSRPHLL